MPIKKRKKSKSKKKNSSVGIANLASFTTKTISSALSNYKIQ